MKSKKIVAVLLAVGVVTASGALVSAKGAFAESVKQDVVYTKEDKSSESKERTKLSEAEDEVIKEKSADALKKYFNISDETIKKCEYGSSIINNKTIDEMQPQEEKMFKDAYEKKEISEEEYNKSKKEVPEHYKALKETVSKLNHGFIQTSWMNDDQCYLIFFNENTKEAEWVIGDTPKPKGSEVSLNLSEEQYKNIAETFVKEHKLGDLENPKCINVKGNHVYYQEENDSNKKTHVVINPYTGKVSSFAIKSYANMFFDEMVNDK